MQVYPVVENHFIPEQLIDEAAEILFQESDSVDIEKYLFNVQDLEHYIYNAKNLKEFIL